MTCVDKHSRWLNWWGCPLSALLSASAFLFFLIIDLQSFFSYATLSFVAGIDTVLPEHSGCSMELFTIAPVNTYDPELMTSPTSWCFKIKRRILPIQGKHVTCKRYPILTYRSTDTYIRGFHHRKSKTLRVTNVMSLIFLHFELEK